MKSVKLLRTITSGYLLTFLISSGLSLSGCSSIKSNPPAPFNIKVFGSAYTPPLLENGQSVLVFFRQPSSRNNHPITVYVDSRYVGSVLPGGYIAVPLCLGNHSIALAGENTLRSIPLNVKNVSLSSLDVSLYELSDNSTGIPNITARNAMDDPSVIRKQNQTISRLQRTDCHSLVPTDLQINEEFSLSSSEQLNATQRDRLGKILNNVQTQLVEVKTIEITAPSYTKPAEDRLVQAQVQAVRDYFSGVLPSSTQVVIKTRTKSGDCPYAKSERCIETVKISANGRAR